MGPKRLAVFDLDGTLVDSLADIGEAMNLLLEELDLPPRPLDEYRWIAGDGARVAVMRASGGRFDDDPKRIDHLTERYLDLYRQRGSHTSQPYDGIESLLTRLAGRTSMAVLTNKPHDIAEELVQRVFGPGVFMAVEGVRPGWARKPDPTGLLRIIERAGVDRAATVYIGDTNTDMETGRAADVFTVGCTWGFRSRGELERAGANEIIDAPMDLLGAIDGA